MSLESSRQDDLHELLSEAKSTQIGQTFKFGSITSYSDFSERVPIHQYEDLKPYIDKMKDGNADILWPGRIQKYAVSSGTTGKGKHLPISAARLASDKKYMRSIAISYIKQRPNPFRLLGKHFSLPGNIEKHGANEIGEMSGFTAAGAPLWLRALQLVQPKKLTKLSFQEKFNLVLRKSIDSNIKVISAMPGWILTLFQRVLNETGKDKISDVWPNLNLLICGGVKLDNYQPHLVKLIGGQEPDFIETYGASEGYFAFSDDLARCDLKLVTGNGIFFEFIQKNSLDNKENASKNIVTLRDVKRNVPYAIVVTTNGGLWRYMLNDIIEFTSTDPPRILVKGRISEMLDDFGEALYIYEAEEVLAESLREMNLQKSPFTIIPQLSSESDLPKHYWLIQFSEQVDSDGLAKLVQKIDTKLQKINRHYATRREGGSLGAPIVKEISQKQVNQWLEAGNRTGAQVKLPKILHDNTELLL